MDSPHAGCFDKSALPKYLAHVFLVAPSEVMSAAAHSGA